MELNPLQKRPPSYNLLAQLLIWDRPLSNLIQYAAFICCNLHCLIILLAYQLLFIAKTNQDILSYFIMRLTKILSFVEIFSSSELSGPKYILMATLIPYFLIFLVPFILSLKDLWFYKRLSHAYNTACIYFGLFHSSLGFWLINAWTMSVLYTTNQGLSQDMAIKAVCTVIIVINYLLAFYFSACSYDPFITSNILSCYSSTLQICNFAFKAIAAPLIFLSASSKGSSIHWPFVLSSIAFLGIRHFLLVRQFPHYNYCTMKIALFLSTACLWTSLINCLGVLNISEKLTSGKNLIYAEIIVCSLFIGITMNSFHKEIYHYLSRQNCSLRSDADFTKKLFSLLFLMEHTKLTSTQETEKNLQELCFYGTLSSQDLQDFLNKKSSLIGGGYVQRQIEGDDKGAMAQVLSGLLEDAVQKFPRNSKFLLLLAASSIHKDVPFQSSMIYLNEIYKHHNNKAKLITLKLYHKLQWKITSFFHENRDTILDLDQYLDHESASLSLNKAVQAILQKYAIFWNTYLQPNLKMQDLFDQSQDIEKDALIVDGLWRKYAENNKIFAGRFCQIYTLYLSLLRASPFHSQRIHQKYSKVYQEQLMKAQDNNLFTNESISSPNVLTIQASICKDKPGLVTHVSANFTQYTGWTTQDVNGRNLNMLMPPFIAFSHNKLLLNHLKKLQMGFTSSKMYSSFSTFCLHKNGYIIPCDAYLSMHPTVQEKPVYLMFIRIKNLTAEEIILNADGNIEGFTQKIGHLLDLRNKTRNHYSTICVNFHEIQFAMERMKTQNADDEVIKESLDIEFRYGSRQNTEGTNSIFSVEMSPYYYDSNIYYVLKVNQNAIIADENGEKTTKTLPVPEKMKSILNEIEAEENSPKKIKEEDEEEEDEVMTMSKIADEHPGNVLHKQTTLSVLGTPTNNAVVVTKNFNTEYAKQEMKIFTTEYGKQETNQPFVTSYVAENDTGNNPIFSSNRELIPKNVQQPTEKAHDAKHVIELQASSSVGSMYKYTVTQFEMAVRNMKKNPQIKSLYALFIFLMIVSSFPTIILQTKISTTLSQVHGSGEVISNVIYKCLRYSDVYSYTRMLWQGTVGLLAIDRYDYLGYSMNTLVYNEGVLSQVLTNIKDANTAVRDFVYKLDPKLSAEIYSDLVPVIEAQADGTDAADRTANLFDLSTEVLSMGIKMLADPLAYNEDNPYLVFLLNNTMNDPLIVGEKEVPILLNDSEKKLNQLSYNVYIVMGVIFVLAILIFCYFHKIVSRFLKERNYLIFVLCGIHEKYVKEHLRMIESFQNVFNRTSLQNKSKISLAQAKNNAQKNSSKKTANTQGLNRIIFLLYLGVAGFLLSICSIYPIMCIIANVNNSKILNALQLLTKSNLRFYQLVFLWDMMYGYDQYDVNRYEYIKNKPILDAVQEAQQQVVNFETFVIGDLLDKQNGLSENTFLNEIAIGNLCDLYTFSDEILTKLCPDLGGGIATKGIIGLYNYFVTSLNTVEDCYTNSQQTWQDSQACLGLEELINVEVIYPYFFQSYRNLDTIIREEIVTSADKYLNSITVLLSTYIGLYVVLGTLAGWKLKKRLEKEINDWRKMIRVIPFMFGNESKAIKGYLSRYRREV